MVLMAAVCHKMPTGGGLCAYGLAHSDSRADSRPDSPYKKITGRAFLVSLIRRSRIRLPGPGKLSPNKSSFGRED